MKSHLWTWFETWVWNATDPGCHHLGESLLFNLPCAGDKSVSRISFWFLSPGQNMLGPGHQFSKAYGLLSGLAQDLRGLRKAQEGNTGNLRSFIPTPGHPAQQKLHPTWISFWAMGHRNYKHGSKRSFAKSGLKTRSITICWSGPQTGGWGTVPGTPGCVPTPVKLSRARGFILP